MKISGFTLIRNGVSFDYPFLESLRSLEPLCDELVVNVGIGTDTTRERIAELARELNARAGFEKVKFFDSHWPLDDPEKKKGGRILSEQTNLALERCTGDWCIYLQSDEVLHEADYPIIRSALYEANPNAEIDALVFDYLHFYGSYDVIQQTRSAYRREVRAIRRASGALSVGDAQSFRLRTGTTGTAKPRALLCGARIFHYGWVRTPEAMREKTFFMDQLYHGAPSVDALATRTPHTGDNYRYKRFWGLRPYIGTHPSIMQKRIAAQGWHWDLAASPLTWQWRDLKKIALDCIERATGARLFEYRSYKLKGRTSARTALIAPFPRAALIASTYNSPKLLEACLRSLLNQTCHAFDLFIADDGSTEETRKVIEAMRPLFASQSTQVHHVWHEDRGYRKARIHNETLRRILEQNAYAVTICVDGDTIAHRRFVEDHLRLHAQADARGNPGNGLLVMGRRIDLGPAITGKILENPDRVTRFNRGLSWLLLLSCMSGETRGWLRAWRVSTPWLQRLLGRHRVHDLLGSNFSVSTRLLAQVNGFNEDFQSYWGEDGDLFIRLRNAGARIHGIKGYAIQYHLFHKRLDPDAASVRQYQERVRDREYQVCANGISKLS